MAHTYNPFLFLKSYDVRLEDFNNVLNKDLKASEIQKGWSEYLELAIEPVGWKAIWRISREICSDLEINFPCTAIVIVQQVNFKELSCQVEVSEIDVEKGDFPSEVADVPLIQLYPTKEQDNSCALVMFETASLIDSLRFFYHNLWMPWDLEFDEETSWIDGHLKGRLQLHFAMLELEVSQDIVYEVRRLVAEGLKISHHIEDVIDSDSEIEVTPQQLLELTELHNRLSELRNTYAIYEKPQLLKAFIERQRTKKETKALTTVVLSSATPEQLSNLIKDLPPSTQQIRLVTTLQEALVKTRTEGFVYVTQGEHNFQDLASLKTGGSIIGLEPGVVLVGDVSGEDCATLDLLKGCLSLSRLTLHMSSTWTIMKIRPGTTCSLKHVQLTGSTITDGIDIHPGATLSAEDCVFDNCQSALTCYPNSTVSLTRCKFTNNNVAIHLREGCNLEMTDCTISGSSVCAIKVSASSSMIETLKPVMDNINRIPGIKEVGTVSERNIAELNFMSNSLNNLCNGI